MKKKGFISISIIYSFFIVFLLLLVLALSTYITNRYSFGIYTKDEKKYHAENVPLVVNSDKVLRIMVGSNYYSSYYSSKTVINEGVAGSEKTVTDTVPYYFLTSKDLKITNKDTTNEVKHIIVYLGDSSEYRLSQEEFFKAEYDTYPSVENISHIGAYIFHYIPKNMSTLDSSIIIIPALNTRYGNWEQYVSKDANELLFDPSISTTDTLINSLVKNVNEAYESNLTIAPNVKISYVGYSSGANAVLRLAGKDTSPTDNEYYLIQSTASCTEAHCDSYIKDNVRPKSSKVHGYCKNVVDGISYCSLMTTVFGADGINKEGNLSTYSGESKNTIMQAISAGLYR